MQASEFSLNYLFNDICPYLVFYLADKRTKIMADRLNQLQLFLEESPNSPFLLFALAKEYEKIENDSQAGHYFKKLIEEHPTYIGTYYHYGKWLEEMEEPEKALGIYEKGIEVASQEKDQHAKSELMNARMNLELER